METIIISHAGCQDGTAAAYAAWRHFGDRAQYLYLNYHDPLPSIPNGSNVYILDYWRKHDEILHLLGGGCRVTVLDHHESAMIDALRLVSRLRGRQSLVAQANPDWIGSNADLLRLDFCACEQEQIEDFVEALKLRQLYIGIGDELQVRFDLDHSGAAIAWETFADRSLAQGGGLGTCEPLSKGAIAWESGSMPDLIRYVEDRDLWRWQLPGSEAVSEALADHMARFRTEWQQSQVMAIAQQLHQEDPSQILFVGFDPTDPLSLSGSLRRICESTLTLNQNPQVEAIAEFQRLDELVFRQNYRESMEAHGTPLIQPRRNAVAAMCRSVDWCEILGYRVPIVQAEHHHSWVGHELCGMFPDAPFSVTYCGGSDGILKVDLRSSRGFRVNRVAQRLGGGGHPAAAGFTVQQIKTLEAGDRFFHVGVVAGVPLHIDPAAGVWEIQESIAEDVGDRSNAIFIDEDYANVWVIKKVKE